MCKLVVFDMDQTLVDSRPEPINRQGHSLLGDVIEMSNGELYYVYMRPYVRIAMKLCRGFPDLKVILFSAGSYEYVHRIVENVIYPVCGGGFSFDRIYTNDDLDDMGIKRMDKLKKEWNAKRILLVDDLYVQCVHGAQHFPGVHWYNIQPFRATDAKADLDTEMLHVLQEPFFFYCNPLITDFGEDEVVPIYDVSFADKDEEEVMLIGSNSEPQ